MNSARDAVWEPGFEPERKLAVIRLGGLQWCFPASQSGMRRFYQRIIPVPVEDWTLDLRDWSPGSGCTVNARLDLRFQPTLAFVQGCLNQAQSAGDIIRHTYHTLLQDQVEQRLESLPPEIWLDDDLSDIETCIGQEIQEFMILSQIQSRCHCTLRFRFLDEVADPGHDTASRPRHQAVIRTLRERLHQARLRHQQDIFEQQAEASRCRIEQQQKMTALLREETEALERHVEEEARKIRAGIALEEVATREKMAGELRLHLERIHQETQLRQTWFETDLAEKNSRAAAMNDVEQHLHREIEFLTLERQRLLLEEEIQQTRQARFKPRIVSG
ncbi:MAG: hypothetical protein RLZZ226_1177 [Pseudomonadota bacterium]